MTPHNLKNPNVVAIPNPVGIDLAIYRIQVNLAAMTWLEKSFGRAWTIPNKTTGESRLEPMVYQGGNEYYPVLANDALKSYSFWRVNGSRNMEDYSPLNNHGTFYLTDPVDVIFWFNLKTIDATKDYIFKEELIQEVLGIMDNDPFVVVKRIWDDKVDDIFRGYTLYQQHRDLLMYPFGAFRFELTLRYEFSCQ